MRRLMPNKIKSQVHVYKSITGMDIIVIFIALLLSALIVFIKMNITVKLILIASILAICALLCSQYGALKGRVYLKYAVIYMFSKKNHPALDIKEQLNVRCKEYMRFDDIVAGVIDIEGIDFLSLDDSPNHDEQSDKINILTELFKEVKNGKIVKYCKNIDYSQYIEKANERLEWLEDKIVDYVANNQNRNIADDYHYKALHAKMAILTNQVCKLEEQQEFGDNQIDAFSLIIFSNNSEPSSLMELESKIEYSLSVLDKVGLKAKRLEGGAIKAFIKNFFNENLNADIDIIKNTAFEIKATKEKATGFQYGEDGEYGIIAVGKYKVYTENAWGAEIFSIPNTRVVFNFSEFVTKDLEKQLDKTIGELNSVACDRKQPERVKNASIDKAIALESVKNACNYNGDIILNTQLFIIFKKSDRKSVMKVLLAQRHSVDNCTFHKYNSFIESWPMVPMRDIHRESILQMQASQIAAMFPYVDAVLRDPDGLFVGYDGTPIFFDLFTRSKIRQSSNMVVFGKLGAGKSFYLKMLMMALNCYGTKLYIFDPENEYEFLCKLLGGEIINVAGNQNGIINVLQVFPALPAEDDPAVPGDVAVRDIQVGAVTAHKQFLEAFFEVVLPQMTPICHQFLAQLITELYKKFKIYDGECLDNLKAEDFPILSDLIDLSLKKEKSTKNDYDREQYHVLNIYLKKFDVDGAYYKLWNGHTSFTIGETEFINFSFRELIGNNNKTIANGQMMLLVMFLNQEIIKTREGNLKAGGAKSKFVIVFDECHNFIDPKFPVALSFMTRMSKQLRKYYGSQITATQNLNDMLDPSPEIRSKTTALINNSNYSMLFGLSDEDVAKVKEVYAKSNNPLKPSEVKFILSAEQGNAVFIVDNKTRMQMKVACYDKDEDFFLRKAEKGS